MHIVGSFTVSLHSQVTIGSGNKPDGDALLDLKEQADGSATKGLVLPRVQLQSTTLAAPLQNHVEGMFVFNTATAGDVTPGIYYNDGTKWIAVKDGSGGTGGNFWGLTGNAGTGYASMLLIEFGRQHFAEKADEIVRKHTEIYNKKYQRILKQTETLKEKAKGRGEETEKPEAALIGG
ncbi:hypothetical protein FACS1894169_04950 [Bacteroidia bacterium]|nr:hypothetical protein FACS1894169_04950 [Bacteroidia bacterium]